MSTLGPGWPTRLVLSADEMDRLRQWFDALQDLSPKFLEPEDFALAERIKDSLGWKTPRPAGTPAEQEL